jgi:drug/metabolite transporter (DMT)-like permease
LAGVLWAWLLLNQLPGLSQLLGGLLVLAGVLAVKLGEPAATSAEPAQDHTARGVSKAGAAAA